jgi:hypothetical protein
MIKISDIIEMMSLFYGIIRIPLDVLYLKNFFVFFFHYSSILSFKFAYVRVYHASIYVYFKLFLFIYLFIDDYELLFLVILSFFFLVKRKSIECTEQQRRDTESNQSHTYRQ